MKMLRWVLRLPPFRPLARRIKSHIDIEVATRIRSIRLVPSAEVAPDDVFIVGYPRSGHTWMQHLVAGVIYGVDPAYAPWALVADLVPDHRPYYKRYATPMFFKSHHLPRPEYRRVVYLLRDGRDAMVSYHHYVSAVREKPVDFLSFVQGEERLWPCKWHEHVEAWLSNPYHAQMLIIKYEDLRHDTVGELRRFCQFVDVERDDALLAEVARKASFQSMRDKEARWPVSNPDWPRDRVFVRRGHIGSFRDEMPRHVLQAFLRDAGDLLRRQGYA